MAEYIEREALMRRIKEIHCAECDSYHGVRCRACWVDDTLDYIDSEPAADVAPVRHAKVIDKIFDDHETIKQPWDYRYYCSACKIPMRDSWNKYCPNCGAKMDLEAADA